MGSPHARRRLWLVLLAASVSLSCDGGDRVSGLYRVERDVWRTGRLERGLRLRREEAPDPAAAGRVLQAYLRILERNPLPAEDATPDTVFLHGLGRLRASAEIGAVRMHRVRGESREVIDLLREASRNYPWDLPITLRLHLELITELLDMGDLDSAAQTYQEMAANLPPRTEDGRPVTPVQDAPIRAADLLLEMGRTEEAAAELDRAELYYRSIIDADPNDQAAALAWVELGTVAARRGQFDRAAVALDRARSSRGAGELQARILMILGTMHQEGRRDLQAAIAAFEQLGREFPNDPVTPEALVRQAACLADLGLTEEALGVVARLHRDYPRDTANRPRAGLLAARILSRADRWQEALSRYHAVQVDYPVSPQALRVPFEIAAHYREIGEPGAARGALERGLNEFDRIRTERVGSPIARMADEATVQALEQLERWAEAVDLLKGFATRYPSDPRYPLALIEAARILKDHLGDAAAAAEILDQVAAAFPDSPLAARAQEEAARLRGR